MHTIVSILFMPTMKKKPTIALTICLLALLLVGGVFEYKKDSLLSKEKGCEQMLDTFQKRMVMQDKYLSDGTFEQKYYDFMVAYSPSLNTCVGGYTKATQVGQNTEYQYSIINILTNSNIVSFDTLGELIKHQDLGTSDVAYGTAGQYAWQDYKKKLSELTDGQIK